MGDHLTTIDTGRKEGEDAVPLLLLFFGGGKLGPHLTQCGLDRDLPAYPVASSILDPSSHLARIDMDRKVGEELCPFLGGAGPHLTQSGLGRGLPPYQVAF